MRSKKGFQYKGLAAGLAAACLAIALYLLRAFEAVEYQLYDLNIRHLWKSQAPAELSVVAVDSASLEKIGRWPWPRAYHAEIIRGIAARGAKVIGVDIGFFEPDRENPENDRALLEATREAGNVVYPAVVEMVTGESGLRQHRFEPLPELKAAAASVGHVHIEHHEDGIVRWVYLQETLGEDALWGWGLEVLRAYLDLPPGSIRRTGPNRLAIGQIEIPVVEAPARLKPGADTILHNYEMNIGFAGDRQTFDYVPAHKVVSGEVPNDYFKGKIVLYGGSAAGLFDSHMTPFSAERSPMPGVEIQANVINTVLRGRYLERASVYVVIALTLAAALAVGFIYQLFESRVAAGALLLFLCGSFLAYAYLFSYRGYWIDATPIHFALVLAFIFALMITMRQVNTALDGEILNLSRATALGEQAGEARIAELFKAAEPTFRDLLGIEAAVLLQVDRDKGLLLPITQYGLGEAPRGKKLRFRIGSLLRGLLIGLDPIPVDGLKDHPLDPLLGKSRGRLHYSLFIPLVAQGETVGVLTVFRPKGAPFRPEEQELLEAAAAELGIVWYNAALYSRLVQISSNPLAPFTYKSQERRIQTLAVLADSVLSEKTMIAAIMDSIGDGVIVTDVMGTIRLLNPKAREILGLYGEEAVGQNAVDFIRRFHDLPYADIKDKFHAVVEQGKTFQFEVKLSLPNTRYYTLALGAVRSKDGLTKGILAVLSDVTEFKEMDQMKNDLMSMVTHEIRTPLATVRGFAQILLKGAIPEAKAREFLEIISRQSNRLVNLVNDFLDITRIESGRQVITRGPVEMEKLVQGVLTDLKPLADEKSIALDYEPPPLPVPEILVDRNLIEQVLINLVSNAIKYSPKGAWARVSLRTEKGFLRVDVKDNGLGIPREALPRLFEKFYRVRSDDRKDIIGTGLGLSLVKQIIQVHEGTVSVESEHGAGSTFTFTLPLKVAGATELGASAREAAALAAPASL
jgi:PAS domain S-box-containing protein